MSEQSTPAETRHDIGGPEGDADARRGAMDLRRRSDTNRETILGLQGQRDADRASIHSLERQAELDQRLIAQLVAEGVVDRDKIANLEVALVAARTIGAAMGIVMFSLKVNQEEAFALLRTASQRQHRKLREVAEDIVETGALPPS